MLFMLILIVIAFPLGVEAETLLEFDHTNFTKVEINGNRLLTWSLGSFYYRSSRSSNYLAVGTESGYAFVYEFNDSGPSVIDTIHNSKMQDVNVNSTGEIIGIMQDDSVFCFYKLHGDTPYHCTQWPENYNLTNGGIKAISQTGKLFQISYTGPWGAIIMSTENDSALAFNGSIAGVDYIAPSKTDYYLKTYYDRNNVSDFGATVCYQLDSMTASVEGVSPGWVNDSTFIIYKIHTQTSKYSTGTTIDKVLLYGLDGQEINMPAGLNALVSKLYADGSLEFLDDSLILFQESTLHNRIVYNIFTGDTLKKSVRDFTPLGKQWGIYTENNPVVRQEWE